MANETLPQGPQAFAGWDSSIYLAWVRAMADILMAKADPNQMAEETLATYGGLMHALTEAVEEMQDRERKEMQALKAA